MEIEIRHLFVSPGHNFKGRHGQEPLAHGVTDCDEIECVAGSGIRGDRYFDHKEDFKGQITFFSVEVHDEVRERFGVPDLPADAYRRNAVVSGVDLNSLIGRRFRIGEVVFEGAEEAAPCHWMDEACSPGAHEFLKGRGGLRARIRVGGSLRKGVQDFELDAE